MKRLRYYLSVLLIAITVCISLTACSAGSTIDTTLKINDDLSGVRVMDVAIDDSVFSESFNGTIEDLNNVIVANCPADITYSYTDESGVKTYTFELAFSSLEDYKTKVTTITGQEPTIDVQVPDTVWVNGFYVSESFSSSALLEWLKTAIVDAGLVSSSDASNIFEDGSSCIEYNGESYTSSSSRINVDEVEYLGIAEIQILTDLIDYDLVNQSIAFTIPLDSMDKKGDEITAYMESVAPSTAKTEWTTDGFDRPIFTISQSNIAVEDITAMLSKVFGTEATCAKVTEIENRPFAFGKQVDYTIDLSNYMVSNQQSTQVSFYMSIPEQFVIGQSTGYLVNKDNFSENSTIYDKYYYVASQWIYGGETLSQTVVEEKLYKLNAMDVTTKRTLTGNFERVTEFALDYVPTEEELAVLVERIDAKVNLVKEESSVEATSAEAETAATETTEAVKEEIPDYKFDVKSKVKDEVATITVTQKGDEEGILYTTGLWTGYAGEFVYAEKYEFFKTKYQEGFSEDINYGVYDDDVTEGFTCTYTVDLGGLSTIVYSDDSSAEISGGKVVLTNTGTEVILVSEHTNVWGVLFYILVVAGIAIIAYVLVKTGVLQEIIDKVKEKSAQNAVQAPVQQEAQPEAVAAMASVAEEQTDAPKIKGYCTNCGTAYEEDACVCTNCGTKLENE